MGLPEGWKMVDVVIRVCETCKCKQSFLKYARGTEYAYECMKCVIPVMESKSAAGNEVVNAVSSA